MTAYLPRVMLAAPRSGGGKTLLTCGLLQLLKERGKRLAAFKCGPDYIDPMFHREVVGVLAGNLDLFFTDGPTVRSLLAGQAEGCDMALIEGVMGFYDGIAGDQFEGSSYHLAGETETPVILVLDCRGAALSLAAEVKGFAELRPDAGIQGVLLNRCSKGMYSILAGAIEEHAGIPVLGYLPQDSRFVLESRHLGLVMTEELTGFRELLSQLADMLAKTVDIEKLLKIAQSAPPLEYTPFDLEPVTGIQPRLAVARDRAFCFYYRENLELLEKLGVELVPFSPLTDRALPPGIQGLYLGGGYPELHAQQLAQNGEMLQSIRDAAADSMPIVAECGGFLYLQRELEDENSRRWPMAGVLPGTSTQEKRLRRFGYITLTAELDNLYCKKGEHIRAHEFHYWHSDCGGDAYTAKKPGRNITWPAMVATENMVAGFPHLYYPANTGFAKNFVAAMAAYKEAGI